MPSDDGLRRLDAAIEEIMHEIERVQKKREQTTTLRTWADKVERDMDQLCQSL